MVLSELEVADDRPSSALLPLANNFTMPFELYLKKVGAMDTSRDGELNGPNGLTFDEDDRLFVSDSHNHRVQIFTKDGQFISKWGQYGSDEGELNLPWGLALDKDHNVYVADWGNSRVQKFSDDGRHLATFGGPESGKGRLYRPSSVAVDSDGDVYVTDYDAHRLVVYELRAEITCRVLRRRLRTSFPMGHGEVRDKRRRSQSAKTGRPVRREVFQVASDRERRRRGTHYRP